jgi:hypothetical protein
MLFSHAIGASEGNGDKGMRLMMVFSNAISA